MVRTHELMTWKPCMASASKRTSVLLALFVAILELLVPLLFLNDVQFRWLATLVTLSALVYRLFAFLLLVTMLRVCFAFYVVVLWSEAQEPRWTESTFLPDWFTHLFGTSILCHHVFFSSRFFFAGSFLRYFFIMWGKAQELFRMGRSFARMVTPTFLGISIIPCMPSCYHVCHHVFFFPFFLLAIF